MPIRRAVRVKPSEVVIIKEPASRNVLSWRTNFIFKKSTEVVADIIFFIILILLVESRMGLRVIETGETLTYS